jgi:hypothetical protein
MLDAMEDIMEESQQLCMKHLMDEVLYESKQGCKPICRKSLEESMKIQLGF